MPSSTPSRDVPTVKIVEQPNTSPTNSENSFLDRLQALLQVSTGAPSTSSPTPPPVSDIVSIVLSPSKSPSTSPSLEPTTEKIPTVVLSPEVIPTVVLSPTNLPTSQPVIDVESADFPSAIPSTEPSVEFHSVVLPTPSEHPSAIPSTEPTVEFHSVVLSPTEPPTSLSPSGYPGAEPTFASPTAHPTTTFGPTTTAEPTLIGSAEDSGLDSIDVPDWLYDKITGQSYKETRDYDETATTEEGADDVSKEAKTTTTLRSDVPSAAPSMSDGSSEPTVLGREQIRTRYRAGNWPPQ